MKLTNFGYFFETTFYITLKNFVVGILLQKNHKISFICENFGKKILKIIAKIEPIHIDSEKSMNLLIRLVIIFIVTILITIIIFLLKAPNCYSSVVFQ